MPVLAPYVVMNGNTGIVIVHVWFKKTPCVMWFYNNVTVRSEHEDSES